MVEIKVKCKCGETRIECFSNPDKEKRCRECMKAAKNSANKKDPITDTEPTDPTHSNWQGGKYAGTVFQRTGDANGIIACVAGKQKRFRFVEYNNDNAKTKEEADKYRKKLSDELEETKNKYKVITIDNVPKYIIVKLSQNYCMLTDYKYLDFIKENNFFVSKGGKTEAKHYVRYQGDNTTLLFHRHVLGILEAGDKVLGDHINRYPLDNREANLRKCSHSVNNSNKTVINSMEYTQEGTQWIGRICYRTNPAKPQEIVEEIFNTIEEAKSWAINKVKQIDSSYSTLSDEGKQLAKEFETIMTQYAGDYKWCDLDDLTNFDVDNVKADKVDEKKEELSVITSKKQTYDKFKLINPDFEPNASVLTSDRKIHHLTHNNVEYKFCSGCDKWSGINQFPANVKNYDSLDRRCKACKSESGKQIRANKKANNPDVIDEDNNQKETNEQAGGQDNFDEPNVSDEQIKQEDPNKYFNKFVKHVKRNDGVVLSDSSEYVNAHCKLKVKCMYGHEFKITLSNINLNRWCGLCSTRKMERYTKEIAETVIGKPFEKIRPVWLTNKNNNKLELDMYNDELKLAIEYNGIQHYKYEKFFHKSKEDFETRVADDELKVKLCKKNHVDLIVVPYTEDPFEFLLKEFITRDFQLVNLDKKISASNECVSRLEKLVGQNQGTILSDYEELLERDNDVKLRCAKSHEWTTKIKNIHRGLWCPTCGLAQDVDTKQKISVKMTKYFSTDAGKKSKQEALAKRSATMRAIKEEKIATIVNKQCKGSCGQVKSLDNFCKKAASADGYQSWCKSCTNDKKKVLRANVNQAPNEIEV